MCNGVLFFLCPGSKVTGKHEWASGVEAALRWKSRGPLPPPLQREAAAAPAHLGSIGLQQLVAVRRRVQTGESGRRDQDDALRVRAAALPLRGAVRGGPEAAGKLPHFPLLSSDVRIDIVIDMSIANQRKNILKIPNRDMYVACLRSRSCVKVL